MTVAEVLARLGRLEFGASSILGDGDCAVSASLKTVVVNSLQIFEDAAVDALVAASIKVVRAKVVEVIFEVPLCRALWHDQPYYRLCFVEVLFGGGRSSATDAEIAERIQTLGSAGGPWFSQEMMGSLAIALSRDIVSVCKGSDGGAYLRVYPKIAGYYKYDNPEDRVLGTWKNGTSGIDFSEY